MHSHGCQWASGQSLSWQDTKKKHVHAGHSTQPNEHTSASGLYIIFTETIQKELSKFSSSYYQIVNKELVASVDTTGTRKRGHCHPNSPLSPWPSYSFWIAFCCLLQLHSSCHQNVILGTIWVAVHTTCVVAAIHKTMSHAVFIRANYFILIQ